MAYDPATQWLLDTMHNPRASLRHRIECAKTLLEVHGHEFDVQGLEKNKRIASKESQKAQKSRKRIREP
jgi:hypothetical protein